MINQALREGGTQVAGSVDYQNSAIPGALGSKADELRGYNLFRGYLAGPGPGTDALNAPSGPVVTVSASPPTRTVTR